MKLTPDQIKKFIIQPYNKYLIDYQIKLKAEHELHITGVGLDEFIEQVDGIENEDYINVKKKLKNAITVKAYEKVLRPKDKILTAKGGTTIFEFSGDEEKESEYKQKLKNYLYKTGYQGYSFKQYTEQVWLDYGIWIDAMGITLVDYVIEGIETLEGKIYKKTDELKFNYISIYEYINGHKYINYHDLQFTSFDKIEYLILNDGSEYKTELVKNKKEDVEYKRYRVIDDEKDEIWLQKVGSPDEIYLVEGSTIYHNFEKVPAVFNSNRVDKKSINKWFTTYCAESLIVAKDYLNDYIDGRIYQKKLGIPRYWEFKTVCRKCNGEGTIRNAHFTLENKNSAEFITCPSCKGNLHETERNLTDITYLDLKESDSQSNVPPSGAVTLPTDIQDQNQRQLEEKEFDLAEIVWGQGSAVNKENRDTTAYEISVRNESKIDKLRAIERNKVQWQTAIINLVGKAKFEGVYKGVVISPATQFMMLTPTENRQVYLESKKAGSPNYQLDKLYNDYLLAEYESDPMSYERNRIIVLLTPLPHMNLDEAWNYLTDEEKTIKKNLEKYIYRYESEEGSILDVSEEPKKLEEINNKFKEYAAQDTADKIEESKQINNQNMES